ncbi:twin-arginine translocation signal domain-containing protein [Campylobacter sp. FMV-PI01]|uniref:Twin-arginine translocation signal domain-containing protein n=1 Tax=Campylobacter portucalensis TaxID=2608384 RepID=A0A6L5WG22_9BACT|nr:twin-arginine translocation signal domain-containing protein [Campylobacter portucalensis]MSN95859.1 twin-arginine translocation signal domain-containing protein [Campylobacter portucalensis]
MQSNRRDFLKKLAIGSAAITVLEAKEPAKKIKNETDKKSETLYKKTLEWELYYKNAK